MTYIVSERAVEQWAVYTCSRDWVIHLRSGMIWRFVLRVVKQFYEQLKCTMNALVVLYLSVDRTLDVVRIDADMHSVDLGTRHFTHLAFQTHHGVLTPLEDCEETCDHGDHSTSLNHTGAVGAWDSASGSSGRRGCAS